MPNLIDISSLPPLPGGWHYEIQKGAPDVVYIDWPQQGGMSVDFKQRIFNLGWTSKPRPGLAAKIAGCADSYTGRGWRDALIRDAVASFRRAVQHPGRGGLA